MKSFLWQVHPSRQNIVLIIMFDLLWMILLIFFVEIDKNNFKSSQQWGGDCPLRCRRDVTCLYQQHVTSPTAGTGPLLPQGNNSSLVLSLLPKHSRAVGQEHTWTPHVRPCACPGPWVARKAANIYSAAVCAPLVRGAAIYILPHLISGALPRPHRT